MPKGSPSTQRKGKKRFLSRAVSFYGSRHKDTATPQVDSIAEARSSSLPGLTEPDQVTKTPRSLLDLDHLFLVIAKDAGNALCYRDLLNNTAKGLALKSTPLLTLDQLRSLSTTLWSFDMQVIKAQLFHLIDQGLFEAILIPTCQSMEAKKNSPPKPVLKFFTDAILHCMKSTADSFANLNSYEECLKKASTISEKLQLLASDQPFLDLEEQSQNWLLSFREELQPHQEALKELLETLTHLIACYNLLIKDQPKSKLINPKEQFFDLTEIATTLVNVRKKNPLVKQSVDALKQRGYGLDLPPPGSIQRGYPLDNTLLSGLQCYYSFVAWLREKGLEENTIRIMLEEVLQHERSSQSIPSNDLNFFKKTTGDWQLFLCKDWYRELTQSPKPPSAKSIIAFLTKKRQELTQDQMPQPDPRRDRIGRSGHL